MRSKLMKASLGLVIVLGLFVSVKAEVEEQVLNSFVVSEYSDSTSIIVKGDVAYTDVSPGERVPDGLLVKLYWEDESGNLHFIEDQLTHYDNHYNVVFDVSVYDYPGITKLIGKSAFDTGGREVKYTSGSFNHGRKRALYFANEGKFSDNSTEKETFVYRKGKLDMFTGYEVPTRDGYIFDGWQSTSFNGIANLGDWDLENTLVPDSHIYLKAKWKEMDYPAFLTLKFVDQNNVEISQEETLEGLHGEAYNLVPKNIDKYIIDEIPANAVGVYDKDINQEIIFKYRYNESEPVTVKYLDTEGNKLKDDLVLTSFIGDEYTATVVSIEGYTIDVLPDNQSIIFGDDTQEIVFIYKKDKKIPDEEIIDDQNDKPAEKEKDKSTPDTGIKNKLTMYYSIIVLSLVIILNVQSRRKKYN